MTRGPAQQSDEPDSSLLARHVAGDAEAFGELVRRHRQRLWAVALRTLGDREEAADALQNALVSAFRRAGSYRGDAAVTTWLHRIVVNACLDEARRRQARPVHLLGHDAGDQAEAVGAVGADPAVASEQRMDVLAALATLPPDQRVAIVLVDMEGYPVAEVAAMLGCPPGTVKSRCARGRARLLVQLEHLRPVPAAAAGNRTEPAPVPPGRPAASAEKGRQ